MRRDIGLPSNSQALLNAPSADSSEQLSNLISMWAPAPNSAALASRVIHLIEDDHLVLEGIKYIFESSGWLVEDYSTAEQFLAEKRPAHDACLVVDVNLPGMSGLALLDVLRAEESPTPAVVLSGRRDATTAVRALKSGASDYIEKPADRTLLLKSVGRAIEGARAAYERRKTLTNAKARFTGLTGREWDVVSRVLKGMPNKNIAMDLNISQRTVESHRANVMKKTGSRTLPQLVEFYLEAGRPLRPSQGVGCIDAHQQLPYQPANN